jgi:hypothetical protein
MSEGRWPVLSADGQLKQVWASLAGALVFRHYSLRLLLDVMMRRAAELLSVEICWDPGVRKTTYARGTIIQLHVFFIAEGLQRYKTGLEPK